MKYEAKSSALQELVQLLMPSILEELNMKEESVPGEVKEAIMPMTEDDSIEEMINAPEIGPEPSKPKGLSLSITELGLMGPKKKPVKKKKKKGRAARRIK